MQITIDLTDEQAARLQQIAESMGVEPHALARAAFADWFAMPQADFQAAAAEVLDKNRELYDRLSR